ncbi:2Fe-2S iron-sulfur cluster-binding protein [Emcibacter nanhaiensis]|uniref:2Fe-2S iron-sulfur cluster binding domain-containing protein n=1 Tax=Emcibacter nanhaiensis TaxID=1505037 RepID=A0A501PJL4_9PROT|nr:2Fe-2S iron-sulfur cluster-binding protein [Emcibacter nanhaiensis]TPD59896.1 2Fe-2S iron-sulfur cluster binding domain-containing protein [Emcibacter nanhaiensis]
MPVIKFISPDGDEQDVEVDNGTSIMQAAVDNSIEGIDGECGGTCSCATCHCYVDEAWMGKAGEADPVEQDMLEFVMDHRPNSRLGCQITMNDDLDGIIIRIPEEQ